MLRAPAVAAASLGWLVLVLQHSAAESVRSPGDALFARANAIRISQINFREATLDEALNFIRTAAMRADPQRKGINIVVFHRPESGSGSVTLQLTNVSVRDALNFVAQASGMQAEPCEYAFEMRPYPTARVDLETHIFEMTKAVREKFKISGAQDVKVFAESYGVPFPPGAEILPSEPDRLVMRNTANSHAIMGRLLPRVDPPPKRAADPVDTIMLPRLSLREATLVEVVDFLRMRSLQIDPAHKGIGIRIENVPTDRMPRITLELTDVPLPVALGYVAELAGCKVARDATGFVIRPLPPEPKPGVTR